jgi:hypothetical protein
MCLYLTYPEASFNFAGRPPVSGREPSWVGLGIGVGVGDRVRVRVRFRVRVRVKVG